MSLNRFSVTALLRRFGVDRAVTFSLALRVWNALCIPVTLSLIASRLSPAGQGFYYSFSGIQALSVVAELGVTFVVGQFAAHEHAVVINETAAPDRRIRAHARLASILKLGLTWNAVAALFTVLAIVPFGIWFFAGTQNSNEVRWFWPWILFAIFSGLSLLLAPLNAVLDGCGHIGDTSLVRLVQTVAATIALWTALIMGAGLFAIVFLPAFAVVGGVLGLLWLHGSTFRHIFTAAQKDHRVNYWAEIFPLQSRVSLSWLSGYVGFYLSTPVVFRILSPELGGRFGMTSNLLLSVMNIAQIWINAKAPRMAQQAALAEHAAMWTTFRAAAIQSLIVLFAGYAVIAVGPHLLFLPARFPFLHRLLGGDVLAIFILAFVFQHLYALINVYLRAFKKEPLFLVSVGAAVLNAAAVSPLATHFGILGVTALYLGCNALCFGLGSAYLLKRSPLLHPSRAC